MTWLQMANLLYENSEALSPRGAHLHLDTAGWLRTWTAYQNQVVDSAARHFSRHREWPPMASEISCQIYFRCLFAIETCIEFNARRCRPANTPEAEQQKLESLLVDCWHLDGLQWAERRYAPKLSRSARACA